jgi:hypothetical protein
MTLREGFAIIRNGLAARRGTGFVLPLLVVLIFFALHGFEPLGLTGLDPFGLGQASGARSEQATQRVLAPFQSASRKVVVVLIDDDFVRQREAGWPLSYAEQGRLLRRVLLAAPLAVVVDLVYPHRHGGAGAQGVPDIAALTRPIETLEPARPVIFTAMAREFAPDESAARATDSRFLPAGFAFCGDEADAATPLAGIFDDESMQPELRSRLGTPADASARNYTGWQVALVRWSGCGTRYPLVLGANPQAVTPAFAAFRAACQVDPRWADCSVDPAREPQSYFEPMRVRWGAFPPAEQLFSSDARTCQQPAAADGTVPAWRRLGVALRELTLGLFEDLRASPRVAVRLPCPAVTVLPLSLLERAPLADWKELLGGRVVLVGASISGIPDYIVAPVHGQVPGVVLHAMALENLVTHGARYSADRYRHATEIVAVALVVVFALCFPLLLQVIEQPALRRALALASAAVWLLIVAVCLQQGSIALAVSALLVAVCLDLVKPGQTGTYFVVLTVAALAAGLTQSLGFPPGNWLGLTLLLLGFGHMLKPFHHGSGVQQLPSRHSLLAALWRRFFGTGTAPAPAVSPAHGSHDPGGG